MRFTKARIMAIFVWLPCCLLLGVFHWVCLLLDEVLFPGYRRVQVKGPLFIVGPPRGGTTFLHRVLAKDTERFACYTFGEMVFAPSILQRKVLALLNRLDRALGAPGRRLLQRIERPFFEPYRYMHEVSLFQPEEDFVMLGYIFANQLLLVVFPFMDLLGHLWHSDRETPPARQETMIRFYKRCIQRHLYCAGPDKIHLSKNPYFTSMIQRLAREFPDAKFVCNARTPYENVPSFLSIWDALYFGIGNSKDHYMAREFILDWLRDTYLYGGEQMRALGTERGAILRYDELVQNPKYAVLRIYEAFGFTPDASFLRTLDAEQQKAQRYRSPHQYSLEKYGLSEAEIEARMGDVFELYGFARAEQEVLHAVHA